MSRITRGTIKAYDAGSHSATVQLAGSLAVWLEDVAVSTAITGADVAVGDECGVVFFTGDDPDDAVIVSLRGGPPTAPSTTLIEDADQDTSVDVEASADADEIEFTIAGTLLMILSSTQLYIDGANLQVDGVMSIGADGVVPTSTTGIKAYHSAAGNVNAVDTLATGDAAASTVRGVTGEARTDNANSGAVGALRGLEFRANHLGSGVVTDHYGVQATTQGSGQSTNRWAQRAIVGPLDDFPTTQGAFLAEGTVATTITVPQHRGFRSVGLVARATITDWTDFLADEVPMVLSAVMSKRYGFRFLDQSTYQTDNIHPFWEEGTPDDADTAGNRFASNTAFFTVLDTSLFGGGQGVMHIHDRATAPTSDPAAGGILYAESGALMWRGSSGTVTTIAPA